MVPEINKSRYQGGNCGNDNGDRVASMNAHNEERAPFTTPMADTIFGPQPMTVLTIPAIFGAQVMMVPTADMTLPTTINILLINRPIFLD